MNCEEAMKCTLITLLLLWVLPTMLAFRQSNDVTTSQDVTNSEQQSRHRIAEQNEADSISSQPAEERQDSADNTSPQPVEEHKDMADILFQPMAERQYMADIALQPVKDDENEALRPLYQTAREDQSKADKTSHPQKDRNETLRWSHQDVWEIQNKAAEMPQQNEMPRQNVKQDDNKTDMMCNHTQHQPHKGNQNETLRIPHPMTKQEGSQTIRLKPYTEGEYRSTDAMLSHMTRTLDMLGNSFNHSKSRWRRETSAVSNEPCICRECADVRREKQEGTKLVNVVYNKQTRSSSILRQDFPACAAADGHDGQSASVKKTCFASAFTDKNPWWIVDIGGVYSFKNLRLSWPAYKHEYTSNKRGSSTKRYQFAAYSLTVDGQYCWGTPEYQKHYEEADKNPGKDYDLLACSRVLTGRYVRLAKRFGSNAKKYYTVQLCELKIWVCDHGYYWNGFSCVPCGSTCDFRCDNYYGCTQVHYWNVAIYKPTSSSSLKFGSGAYAVDGFTVTKTALQCFYSDVAMDGKRKRWWTVNLLGLYKIRNVILFPRLDCCAERLTNFDILVYRQKLSFDESPKVADDIKCTWQLFTGKPPVGLALNFVCRRIMKGQYITILKDPPESLELCEVQALGYSYRVVNYGEPCGNQITECPEGSTCTGPKNQKKTCRKPIGSECTKNAECIPGGVICDGSGKCALDLNQACSKHRNNCRSGTVCDEQSGLTCKLTVGKPCTKPTDCRGGAVCDNIKICKNAVNHVCSNSATCVAGAICDQKTKTCKCDAPATPNGKLCKVSDGRVGSSCKISTNPCTASNSSCSSKTAVGKCVCNSGWQANTDFMCKSKPGTACSTSSECITSICEGGTCILRKGDSCKNLNFCGADGVCDSGDVCKIKTGEICKGKQTMCKAGTLCEGGVCKVKLGYACANTSYCAGETVCAHNQRSKTVKICSLKPGQSCLGDKSTLCTAGTVCTPDGVCKLELGQPCNPAAANSHCIHPTTKCDAGTKKCKQVLGATCKVDDDCSVGSVCDNSKQCTLLKDAACTDRPNMCLVGSTCTGGKCTCISGSTKTDTKKCDPLDKKAEGVCSDTCDDDFAICINGICKCSGNFVTLSDYTCGAGPGALCANSSSHCVPGTICDVTGVCHLEVGESCAKPKKSLCRIGTICDKDNTCKLQIHEDCSKYRDMCATGTHCDAAGRCKIARGSFCLEDKVCVAGATCQSATANSDGKCTCTKGVSEAKGNICDPDAGRIGGFCSRSSPCADKGRSQCNTVTSTCACKAGFVLEEKDFSCKLDVGKSCADNEDKCKSGMTCDDATNDCRVKLGETCNPESLNPCVTGASCDYYGICKLGLNGNCSGANMAYCKTGTYCDFTGKCRLGSGTRCNETSRETECVAGADCHNSTCVCNTDITTVVGVICAPVAGRANAACNDVDMPCTVPHSACVDGFCVCNDDYTPTHEFACSPPTYGATDKTKGSMLWLVAAILAAVVVVVSGGGYIFYKNRQRNTAAKAALRQQSAASLAELRKLSTAPELSEQPESSMYSETTGATSEANSQAEPSGVTLQAEPSNVDNTEFSVSHV